MVFRPNRVDATVFRPSQPLYSIGHSLQNNQSVAAAVQWFSRHDRCTYLSSDRNTSPPTTRSNSTLTKSHGSTDSDQPVEKGLPTAAQLDHVFNRLGEDVSSLSTAFFSLKH